MAENTYMGFTGVISPLQVELVIRRMTIFLTWDLMLIIVIAVHDILLMVQKGKRLACDGGIVSLVTADLAHQVHG